MLFASVYINSIHQSWLY